jgi:hypothetical protein
MTAPHHSQPGSDYADLVRELHQAAEQYDRGHGPLHAAAANAIDHLMTLIRLMAPGAARPDADYETDRRASMGGTHAHPTKNPPEGIGQ